MYEEAKGLAAEGEEYVNFYVGRQAADFREVIFEDAGHMNFCDLLNNSQNNLTPAHSDFQGIPTHPPCPCQGGLQE